MKRGVIIIEEDGTVNVPEVPVWMSMEEMADLFCVFGYDIRKAVKSIYMDGVLTETDTRNSVKLDCRTSVDVYSLEMVIAASYKIKSFNACLFRKYLEDRVIQDRKRNFMYLMLSECGKAGIQN